MIRSICFFVEVTGLLIPTCMPETLRESPLCYDFEPQPWLVLIQRR